MLHQDVKFPVVRKLYAIQRSDKVGASGLVNFNTDIAYHFYPSLSAAFMQPGALTLGNLFTKMSNIPWTARRPFAGLRSPISLDCKEAIHYTEMSNFYWTVRTLFSTLRYLISPGLW